MRTRVAEVLALGGDQAGTEIARLLDERRVRRPFEGEAHRLGRRAEVRLEDPQRRRIRPHQPSAKEQKGG
jgi:hypothetical protein